MRYILPLIAAAMLLYYAQASGQICPATPEGYVRQYRPDGIPANYPPPEEPSCYMIGTQTAGNNYASCTLCHSYMQRSLA